MNGGGKKLTLTETERDIQRSNHSLRICYKKFSRLSRYLPDLPEQYRIEFMRRCRIEQLEILKSKEKEREKLRVKARKPPELFRDARLTDQALKDPWE